MKDLTVILEDRAGGLADLGDATGGANINIEGMCATTAGGKGEVHILVADPTATREALEGAGMEVSGERDVLVIEVEDRPARWPPLPASSATLASTSSSPTPPSAASRSSSASTIWRRRGRPGSVGRPTPEHAGMPRRPGPAVWRGGSLTLGLLLDPRGA